MQGSGGQGLIGLHEGVALEGALVAEDVDRGVLYGGAGGSLVARWIGVGGRLPE